MVWMIGRNCAICLLRSKVRSVPAFDGSGPLAAWFRANDPYHEVADRFFRSFDGGLVTTWPVVVEVTHLLRPQAQLLFLAWLRKGGIELVAVEAEDLKPLERLIAKYRDQPMDFADASLILLAERRGIDDVVTLDRRQFDVYRFRGNRRFNPLLPVISRRSRRRR